MREVTPRGGGCMKGVETRGKQREGVGTTFCPSSAHPVSAEEVGRIRTSEAERKSEAFQALPYKHTA